MRRLLTVALCAALLLGSAGYLAVPMVGQYVAERQVDKALKRLRVQTTSVVNRGPVTVDVWNRIVTVAGLTIDGPGTGSSVNFGKLTVTRPAVADEQLTAASIVADDVTILAGADKTTIPRVEITDYSGPERGLTTTPGVGANARSQAEVIGRVSFGRASAPVISIRNTQSRVARTIRNPSVTKVVDGVIERAELSGFQLEVPYPDPGQERAAASAAISGGKVVYEGLNLATLWRFYAGDGSGQRESLIKAFTVSDIEIESTLRRDGHVSAGVAELSLKNVEARSLGYSLAKLDPIAARLHLGDAPTPAQVREQLLLAVDGSSSIGFESIALSGVRWKSDGKGEPVREGRLDRVAIGRYADATLDSVTIAGLDYRGEDGVRLALANAEAQRLDARGLVDHARRVGRNEVLLTTNPTADEIVKIFPRVTRVDFGGLEAANRSGSIKVGSAKADIDAPLDAVPQRVKLRLDALDLAPPQGSTIADLLKRVELEGLKGSAKIALTLDPVANTLSLDALDYDFEQLGAVTAKGELSRVDPMLAVATGAAFVDQFTAVRLGPVRITARDDGAMAVLLRRAAEQAGRSPEEFRESFARETQATISRVFGPPAENSAESAARFIRDPRGVEITVTPRNPDQSLLDFIRSLDLGPEGVAQTIELAVLYRR